MGEVATEGAIKMHVFMHVEEGISVVGIADKVEEGTDVADEERVAK